MALRVTASSVETFWNVYVTGAALAKARKTSPRSLAAKLTESGILPVVGPAVDGSRQNIYRVADVSALA